MKYTKDVETKLDVSEVQEGDIVKCENPWFLYLVLERKGDKLKVRVSTDSEGSFDINLGIVKRIMRRREQC